jgi:hypothetical protein
LPDDEVALEVAFFCAHVQLVRMHMLAQGDGVCGDFVARRMMAFGMG